VAKGRSQRKRGAKARSGGVKRGGAGTRGGAPRGRVRSLRRRRRERKLGIVERIDALLDRSRRQAVSPAFDRRSDERPPPARYLTIKGNRELFDKLVLLDFDYLLAQKFAADTETLRCLLPQSVHGRAQNGHGWFRDTDGTPLAFPEATFDRVLTVLERHDPRFNGRVVRLERERRIVAVREHVLAHLERSELPLSADGEPLLGVSLLSGETVETRAFLTGMVLAGFMDDWRHREMALSYQPLTFGGEPLELGGGEIHVARPDRLAQLGIVDAGRGEFGERELEYLRMLDVIVPEVAGRVYEYGEFDQVYFRRRRGEGVCDDLALVYAAARFGWDALLGAFVMDGIDTYDKYVWRFTGEGFDTRLARAIREGWQERRGEGLVSDEVVLRLIHFAAKLNDPPAPLSSSHRRFIQIEPGARVATLLNHWRFTQGEPIFDIELGYARYPSREFYDTACKRLLQSGLPAPTPEFIVARRPGGREGRQR
jgi:hypothetical protein